MFDKFTQLLQEIVQKLKKVNSKANTNEFNSEENQNNFDSEDSKSRPFKDSPLFSNSSNLTDTKVKSKQYRLLLAILTGALIGLFIIIKLPTNLISSKKKTGDTSEKSKIKVELANKALDPEIMWRNHFEDKLTEADKSNLQKINQAKDDLVDQNNKQLRIYEDKIKNLEEKVLFAQSQMKEGISEVYQVRDAMNQVPAEKAESSAENN